MVGDVMIFQLIQLVSYYYKVIVNYFIISYYIFMINIIKSPYDDREYNGFVLPNNLKVVVISDKKTDISSCCLTVGFGGLSDGDIIGLSHFVEHMMFMGSKKYPNENEFMKYITLYNGETNAITTADYTSYYYSINYKYLKKSLDIFGSIFNEPLFSKDAIKREINAVNSEHLKNVTSDGWRKYFLSRTLSNKKVGFHKASTGSIETLNVPDIRDKVVDFFDKYYSANNMYLCVLGKESVNELTRMVTDIFSSIKNNEVKEVSCDILYDIYPQYCKYSPITDELFISIMWEYKFDDELVNYKPFVYIDRLLFSKNNGTLFDYLKNKDWVVTFDSNVEIVGGRFLYTITVGSTTEGIENHVELLRNMEMYIELLKNNVTKEYYDECKRSSEISFFLSDKEYPNDIVFNMSSNMRILKIPIEKVLMTDLFTYDFNDDIKKKIINCLDFMKLNNSIIIISSKQYKSECTMYEKTHNMYYKVEYKIPEEKHNIVKFMLPEKNPYITNDISIKDIDIFKYPKKISNDKMKIYYNPKNVLPFVNVACVIYTPNIISNLHDFVTSAVALSCYYNKLENLINMYSYVNGSINMRIEYDIIYIYIYGLRSVIDIVIKDLVNILKSDIDEQVFKLEQKLYYTDLRRRKYDPPYIKVVDFFTSIVDSKAWTTNNKIKELKELEYKDVINFWNKIIKSNVVMYVQGNISEKEVINISNNFSFFIREPYKLSKKDMEIINSEKDNTRVIGINDNKKENSNGMLYVCKLWYSQVTDKTDWYMLHCNTEILSNILNEMFFNQLRTKKQVGYIVKCFKMSLGYFQYSLKTIGFLIQSTMDSEEIFKLIEQFIKDGKKYLNDISDKTFNDMVKTYYSRLKNNTFSNDIEEYGYYINMIMRQHEVFDIKLKMADYYKNMKKKDIIDFYEKYIYNNTYWKVSLEIQNE